MRILCCAFALSLYVIFSATSAVAESVVNGNLNYEEDITVNQNIDTTDGSSFHLGGINLDNDTIDSDINVNSSIDVGGNIKLQNGARMNAGGLKVSSSHIGGQMKFDSSVQTKGDINGGQGSIIGMGGLEIGDSQNSASVGSQAATPVNTQSLPEVGAVLNPGAALQPLPVETDTAPPTESGFAGNTESPAAPVVDGNLSADLSSDVTEPALVDTVDPAVSAIADEDLTDISALAMQEMAALGDKYRSDGEIDVDALYQDYLDLVMKYNVSGDYIHNDGDNEYWKALKDSLGVTAGDKNALDAIVMLNDKANYDYEYIENEVSLRRDAINRMEKLGSDIAKKIFEGKLTSSELYDVLREGYMSAYVEGNSRLGREYVFDAKGNPGWEKLKATIGYGENAKADRLIGDLAAYLENSSADDRREQYKEAMYVSKTTVKPDYYGNGSYTYSQTAVMDKDEIYNLYHRVVGGESGTDSGKNRTENLQTGTLAAYSPPQDKDGNTIELAGNYQCPNLTQSLLRLLGHKEPADGHGNGNVVYQTIGREVDTEGKHIFQSGITASAATSAPDPGAVISFTGTPDKKTGETYGHVAIVTSVSEGRDSGNGVSTYEVGIMQQNISNKGRDVITMTHDATGWHTTAHNGVVGWANPNFN